MRSPYHRARTQRSQTRRRAVRHSAEAAREVIEPLRHLTPEARQDFQVQGETLLWNHVPHAVQVLIDALSAMKITSFGGTITESKRVPDHWIRMQAADRIHKLTIAPIIEEKELRQQIVILNAIGGVYAERLRRAGVRARGTVTLPDLSEVLGTSEVNPDKR